MRTYGTPGKTSLILLKSCGTISGDLTACLARCQCSAWGPREMKNAVGCEYVLHVLLFIRSKEDRKWKTLVLFATKSLAGCPPVMLNNLLARLARGPIRRGTQDHGQSRLFLNPRLGTTV
jgi:hypothetical protein